MTDRPAEHGRPHETGSAALPVYALVLLTEIVWMAIVPLMPTYARTEGLSGVQSGAVLASAGIATLLVSLPVGLLSDRLGARTLVIPAAAFVTTSSLAQALATSFWSLIAERAVFGIALGIVWTAGIAWLAEAKSTQGRPESLGFPTMVAGIGIVIGPAFAGLLADNTNVHAPFYVLTAVGIPVLIALMHAPPGQGTELAREPLVQTLTKTRHERVLLASLLVMTLTGLASGALNLVVPLQLRADGLSSGAIGVALSGGSLVFVVSSALISRHPRSVELRVVGIAALVYAATMLLAAADTGTSGLLAFLFLRAPSWGALSTLAFPLAAVGARRAPAALGAINGLLNLGWGIAGSAGPILAAALASTVGTSSVFAALGTAIGVFGAWLLASERSSRDGAIVAPAKACDVLLDRVRGEGC